MSAARMARGSITPLWWIAATVPLWGGASGAQGIESGHLEPACHAELQAKVARLERELTARRRALPPIPSGPKASETQRARDQALMQEAYARLEQTGREAEACSKRLRQQHRQPQ